MTEIIYDPHLPVAYVGGQVVPTGKRGVTAQEMLEGLQDALTVAYEGKDPTKLGMTKKQAIEKSLADQAADGDLTAINMVLDRTLGKPVQQVQSLNVTTNLKDFLNGLISANNRAESGTSTPF